MHDRTPKPKLSKILKGLFIICFLSILFIFLLGSFCVIYYTSEVAYGILILVLPIVLGGVIAINIIDMQNSYVEFTGKEIHIINYYCFIKKIKVINFSDVDHIKCIRANSFKIKGRRINVACMSYIVFFTKSGKYLFKLMNTPEALAFTTEILGLK